MTSVFPLEDLRKTPNFWALFVAGLCTFHPRIPGHGGQTEDQWPNKHNTNLEKFEDVNPVMKIYS